MKLLVFFTEECTILADLNTTITTQSLPFLDDLIFIAMSIFLYIPTYQYQKMYQIFELIDMIYDLLKVIFKAGIPGKTILLVEFCDLFARSTTFLKALSSFRCG